MVSIAYFSIIKNYDFPHQVDFLLNPPLELNTAEMEPLHWLGLHQQWSFWWSTELAGLEFQLQNGETWNSYAVTETQDDNNKKNFTHQ